MAGTEYSEQADKACRMTYTCRQRNRKNMDRHEAGREKKYVETGSK